MPPTNEQIGSGLTVAGNVLTAISPALAAIPVAGPIAVVVDEIAGELLGMAGRGFTASAAARADVLAKAVALRDSLKAARTAEETSEEALDAATEAKIHAAEQPVVPTITMPPVVITPTGIPVVTDVPSILPRYDEKTTK